MEARKDLRDELEVLQARGDLRLEKVWEAVQHYIPKMTAAVAADVRTDDFWVRWFLWESCPHEGKYGDDGEMQCNVVSGGMDFKRDSMWEIQRHVQEAVANRDFDLEEARKEREAFRLRVAELVVERDKTSKQHEHMLDLLKNIYYGELGYKNPGHEHIQAIRRLLNE